MDKIYLFRVFAKSFENNSFSKAAKELSISRSSVTIAIKDLENLLKTQLFHRTTRKISPTQDGLLFYNECVHILSEVERAKKMFSRVGSEISGTIKISIPRFILEKRFFDSLKYFTEKYKHIKFLIKSSDDFINPVDGGFDFVVHVRNLPDSSIIVKSIGKISMINVASPSYLKKFGIPNTPSDLKEHLSIGYPLPHNLESARPFVNNEINSKISMNYKISVDNQEKAILACLSGMGITQVPKFSVEKYISSGELIPVLESYFNESYPIHLLFSNRKNRSPKLDAVSKWVEKTIGNIFTTI